jgi:hypothetical protein
LKLESGTAALREMATRPVPSFGLFYFTSLIDCANVRFAAPLMYRDLSSSAYVSELESGDCCYRLLPD